MAYDRRLPPAPSPPTHSRLPPDGHEFPATYTDSVPPTDKNSRYSLPRSHSRSRSRDGRDSSQGTSRGGATSLTRTSSLSSRWRRQDEKSEKSVRDKIAMFSQSKGKKREGSDSPDTNGGEAEVSRGFSEADVRSIQNGSPCPKLSKTTTYSSMINVSSQNQETIKTQVKSANSEVDVSRDGRSLHNHRPIPRQESAEREESNDENGLHHRSQSLIDIERTSRGKRHSVGSYDRPSQFQGNSEKPEDRDRRTSIANLIDLRRKGLSKLRGLVIPEAKPGEISSRPPIDLPRIGSSPPLVPPSVTSASAVHKTLSLPRDVNRSQRLYKTDSISSIESCESNTSKQSSTISTLSWKTQNSTSTISKFSPAVKRKNSGISRPDSLPPVGSRTARSCSPASGENILLSPQKQLSDGFTTPSSDLSFEIDHKIGGEKSSFTKYSLISSRISADSRMNRSEDSDNDSAVSSTQSSFSQGMTPPASPVPDSSDMEDGRLTNRSQIKIRHSPQCSFDELDPKRVLKTGTIEAENRWNVIKSAKVSSGRSSDEHSTPELNRKATSATKDSSFTKKLDSELREGPPKNGIKRQSSNDSSSTLTSRRSSGGSDSRRNSRDSINQVSKSDDLHYSVEQVYVDNQGDMYKGTEIKVAYVNEITDDFEQITEPNTSGVPTNVIAEVPMNRGIVAEERESRIKNKHPPSDDRWAALELKYGKSSRNDIESKIFKMKASEATSSTTPERTRSVEKKQVRPQAPGSKNFKAIAEKWKQRAEVEDEAPAGTRASPPLIVSPRSSKPEESSLPNGREQRPCSLQLTRPDIPDRKLSMPEYGNSGVRMRDRRGETNNNSSDIPSRPSSLIENCSEPIQSLEPETTYLTPCSPAASGSTDSLDASSSLSRTSSKEVLEAFSKPRTLGQFVTIGSRIGTGSSNPPRVSDIMKAFEHRGLNSSTTHHRMSSMDSSDDGSIGGHYGSVTSLTSGTRDQYGSITSLASSTSIISSQVRSQKLSFLNHTTSII